MATSMDLVYLLNIAYDWSLFIKYGLRLAIATQLQIGE